MFCACCARIVAIRISQGKHFWDDLCHSCKLKAVESLRKDEVLTESR